MNKRKRRERLAAKRAEARPVVLCFFTPREHEEYFPVVDQATARRRPVAGINYAQIDEKMVRRLRENTGASGKGELRS